MKKGYNGFEIKAIRLHTIRRKAMGLKSQQALFDVVKWYDSMKAGYDKCGSYSFCKGCDKTDSYPCARAAHRYQHGYVRVAIARRR